LQGYNRREAGEQWLVVNQYRACATLTKAAAELRAIQRKIVTQDIKQRRRPVRIDPMFATIDVERDHVASELKDVRCRLSQAIFIMT
jgi:hypothetical protein